MKIRYMYQLLISHVGVSILAIILLGLLFVHYMEEFVYEDKVDELTSYGEDILYDINRGRTGADLQPYTLILQGRNIDFSVFDNEGRVLYPVTGEYRNPQLTEEEWEQIQQGSKLEITRDVARFDQTVSLVVLPYFEGGALAGGILLVSPISNSAEMISQINNFLLYTVFIALASALLLSYVLSRFHVNRIERLRHATSAVARGDYDVDVPSSDFDEIGELANDFHEMTVKIKKSNEEIESLENRRRQFIADVSHEMRTPLTTINGVIEGIERNMIEESEKEKGLQLIGQETKRLIRLVNENLDYEKIRSNQITLQKNTIQASEILEVIKEFLVIQAEEKENEIIIDSSEEVMVYADYDRLIQILMNITKNSLQFTEKGQVWLRARQQNDAAIFEIEDTGIGIEPEKIESIWRRFYKADLSRTNITFGEFGLGLSVVKRLVELHDGTIDVKSEQGRGTTFIIRLPIQ
ncbi:sensor histidine kinase [Alteribacillus sp. HJP-4]|uniref:sensor histidine kinase n=1 Tax=Alteribacillus sp. HJP-4 TaxID=2775394 RepID=UPI0035CD112E